MIVSCSLFFAFYLSLEDLRWETMTDVCLGRPSIYLAYLLQDGKARRIISARPLRGGQRLCWWMKSMPGRLTPRDEIPLRDLPTRNGSNPPETRWWMANKYNWSAFERWLGKKNLWNGIPWMQAEVRPVTIDFHPSCVQNTVILHDCDEDETIKQSHSEWSRIITLVWSRIITLMWLLIITPKWSRIPNHTQWWLKWSRIITLRWSRIITLKWSRIITLKWSRIITLKWSRIITLKWSRIITLKWSRIITLKWSRIITQVIADNHTQVIADNHTQVISDNHSSDRG